MDMLARELGLEPADVRRKNFIQPSEFLLNPEGKVMASSYSDGPIGRIDAADVLKIINFYESKK